MTNRSDAQRNRRIREALNLPPPPRVSSPRRTVQRAQLLADGHKALGLIQAGRMINDVLMVIPGSRARLYRALGEAMRDNAAPTELELEEQCEAEAIERDAMLL